MWHRNKEKNNFVQRHIHQAEVHLRQQDYQNLHQNQDSQSLQMVHPSAWIWMLDTDKRPRIVERRL